MNNTKQKTKTAANIGFEGSCNIKEAAQLLHIPYETAKNLIRKGTLKTFTYGKGMSPRVLLSSVQELIKKSDNH